MQIIIYLGCTILIVLGLGMFRNWKVKIIKQNSFSILIACRNEQENLPELFAALNNLNYPEDKFEIIIVDDASSDRSPAMIEGFCSLKSYAHCFLLQEKSAEYKGKKAALKKAVENAKYDFLLFTDADCVPAPEWINGYNQFIADEVGMVIGIYSEKHASSFRRFCTQFSFALFASTTALGFPFSAAGGNMCVKKSVFDEVGGYEKIKSHTAGDDKLLLQLIQKTHHKIAYNQHNHVITRVSEPGSNNYKRKYGKARISAPAIKVLSLLILLFYLSFPVYVVAFKAWDFLLLYFESLLFFWICNLLKHKFRFKLTDLFYLLIYPYFVIFYSFWGIFRSWKWKEQEAKS